MAFDDLDEALDEQGEQQEKEDPTNSTQVSETSTEGESERPVTDSRTEPDAEPAQPTDSHTASADEWKRSAAFPYDDASQEAIYPRDEVWSEMEQILQYDIERELVTDRGHENVSKRELHDAMIQVAKAHKDEIIEAFETARRE